MAVGQDLPFVFEFVTPFAEHDAGLVAWGVVSVLPTVGTPDFVVGGRGAASFFAEVALAVFADSPKGDELIESPYLVGDAFELFGVWFAAVAGEPGEVEFRKFDSSEVGGWGCGVELGESSGVVVDGGWEFGEFLVLAAFWAGGEREAFDDAGRVAGGGAGVVDGVAGEAGEHVGDLVDGVVPVSAGVGEGVGELVCVVAPVFGVAVHHGLLSGMCLEFVEGASWFGVGVFHRLVGGGFGLTLTRGPP